jgi:DNA-binding MarR family transcriptional regulator
MTSVNQWVAPDEQHAPLLLGFLLQKARAAFATEDWDGLRQSHFRVLVSVPAAGISITELAERVAMTKQGCGQFVSQLVDGGYLAIERDPADRRTRIVVRTDAGRRMAQDVTARNLRIEKEWEQIVGSTRYAAFRRVLRELAEAD